MARVSRAKAPKSPAETLDLAVSGLQSFHIEKMHRSGLLGAPYNPRILTPAAARKLRTGMKRHGLVEPVVWNKRSGNICGGHQRINQLDALAGTSDYTLDVAVIDVDDTNEKEINVLLNNGEAQGFWDIGKLGALVKDAGLSLDGMGFDHADVFRIFGDNVIMARVDDPLDEFAAKVRDARDRYAAIAEKSAQRDEENFYMVVVFRDTEALTSFMKRAGLEDNRYQSGEDIARLCGQQIPE